MGTHAHARAHASQDEDEQITPERSSRKSHGRPYRRHSDERDHTSTAVDACATKRQLFARAQPSAEYLPRHTSVGINGQDAAGCHPQYLRPQPQPQPQPQACIRPAKMPRIFLPRISPASPPHLPHTSPASPPRLPRIYPMESPSHVYPPSQAACASFTKTLHNLQSDLEDLDAFLVSEQISAKYHPQEATGRLPLTVYDQGMLSTGYHPQKAGYLFATSQLTMTPANLLAHLRRATSSISSISVAASPAKPMAQARHGIELGCGGPEVRVMGLIELGVDQHLSLDHIGTTTPPRHHLSCVRRASLTSTSTTWTSATLWPSAHADRSEAWPAGTSRSLHNSSTA